MLSSHSFHIALPRASLPTHSFQHFLIPYAVTSAGIPGPKATPDTASATDLKSKLWTHESVEAWTDVMDADVTSVYFSTVAFLPLLQAAANEHGHFSPSVITISSISGLIRDAQGHVSVLFSLKLKTLSILEVDH